MAKKKKLKKRIVELEQELISLKSEIEKLKVEKIELRYDIYQMVMRPRMPKTIIREDIWRNTFKFERDLNCAMWAGNAATVSEKPNPERGEDNVGYHRSRYL